ncbi:hypothetical protein [Nonomuraea sp. B19D2]|uniref:hypothetical protein n=1 Tax=Nonomuraea sp. B19D2 TaxID=3159561 RepID=UPI0032DB2E1E
MVVPEEAGIGSDADAGLQAAHDINHGRGVHILVRVHADHDFADRLGLQNARHDCAAPFARR